MKVNEGENNPPIRAFINIIKKQKSNSDCKDYIVFSFFFFKNT